MWNPFKKTGQSDDDQADDAKINSPKMNMLQRLAMKKMEKMSPNEKAKMAQEFFKPENKDKLMSVLEMMRKTGQVSEEQYNLAKQKMGE
ncbi:MAG TPA: hypothetical protein DCS28_04325 [Candidatus Moranbacteria bacterium]|nr:hypothetical protein [Candidatus Moranbacteria bacterium]HAT75236.1 hypothetical protein [Candidatus Moranbacteria bacterium]